MGSPDFDDAVEKNHEWLSEFIKGNVEPAKPNASTAGYSLEPR